MWSPHLRGHLLLFDRKPAPAYSPNAGVRLLLAAAFVEVLRLAAVRWLYPDTPRWLLLPVPSSAWELVVSQERSLEVLCSWRSARTNTTKDVQGLPSWWASPLELFLAERAQRLAPVSMDSFTEPSTFRHHRGPA